MKFPKNKLMFIEWEDIVDYSGWQSFKRLEDCTTASMITVGFVVEETEKYIKVTANPCLKDLDFIGIIVLPKGVITKATVLTEGVTLHEKEYNRKNIKVSNSK